MNLDALDEFGSSIIERVWRNPKFPIPDEVYHYTDAAGLIGILQSKQLWATEYRFMNDAAEIELGLRRAKQIVRSLSLKEKVDRRRRFLQRLLRKLDDGNEKSSYVISLTEERDDLSQWRGYANNGLGYVLGFDGKCINEIAKDDTQSFGKVYYSSSKQEAILNQAISDMYDYMNKERKGSPRVSDMEECCDELEAVISSLAASFKHLSFSSENEWRLHHYPEKADIRVRAATGKLVPYVPVNLFCEDTSFPLRSIGIGPGFRARENKYALEKLLNQHSIEAEIYFASTPYRPG